MDSEKTSWKSQALPVIAGAGVSIVALYFLLGREPPPRSRAESSPSATASAAAPSPSASSTAPLSAAPSAAAAPPASGAASAGPAASSSARATSVASGAPQAPAAAPPAPVPGERTARVVWDAMGRHRAPNAAAGGIACTIEATVAALPEGALGLRALLVQCGGKTLYEVSAVPQGASAAIEERPALDRGSFAVALRYRDERAEIDTAVGGAVVDVTAPVIGTAWLAVANESRPMKERLSAATPEERALPGAAADRLAAHVATATGDTVVAKDAPCVIAFSPYGPASGAGRCDVFVQCGPVTVIGQPKAFSAKCTRKDGKVIGAVDGEAEPADDDPGLLIDEKGGRVWNGANGARWSITLALDAPKPP